MYDSRMTILRQKGLYAAGVVLATMLMLALFASPALAQTLDVTKKDEPDPVREGDTLTYTVKVQNIGTANSTNVQLTDTLPANTTFVSVSTSQGNCPTQPSQGAPSGPVQCNLGTIAGGATATVTIKVKPTAAAVTAGSVTNQATAKSNEDPVGDTATTTTQVGPRLEINKLDDPDPVTGEDLLLYTLRVRNEGTVAATDVIVEDDLPLDDVDLVSVSSSNFDCDEPSGGFVQCKRNKLDPGKTATIEIVVEPEDNGTIKNTAKVFAQGINDPLDKDTETTTVENIDNSGGGNNNNNGNNNSNNDNNGTSDNGQVSDVSDTSTTDDTEDTDTTDDTGTDTTSTDDTGTTDDTGSDTTASTDDTGTADATTNPDEQAPVSDPQGDVVDEVPFNEPLPETGGLPLALLVIGAGLISGGVFVIRLVRRR